MSSGTTVANLYSFFFFILFPFSLDLRSVPIDSDDRYAAGQLLGCIRC